jgi:putative DNA methylase
MKGWYSRGYLPHFDAGRVVQTVTFRLADSLPSSVTRALETLTDQQQRRARVDRALDQCHGECWLRDPECARAIQDALLHFDGVRYRLIAWCVMPNHVHVIFEPLAIDSSSPHETWSLAKLVHSWKSWSANLINTRMGRSGAVWQRDFYDRYIRDEEHFLRALNYVHDNPVKAKLVAEAEKWPFSSASKHRADDA